MKVQTRRSSAKSVNISPSEMSLDSEKTKSCLRSLDGCGLWVVWPKGFGLT